MIPISKQERAELERVGLLKYRKGGRNPQDQNFMVTNRQGKSGAKTIYITESFEIMTFLEKYDNLGYYLVLVWPNQLDRMVHEGIIKEDMIQRHGRYIPNAQAYVDREGKCRVRKNGKVMEFLSRKKKDSNSNSNK